jgi:hypothetical protein
VRRRDLYRFINYTHRRGTCRDKVRYLSQSDAQNVAHEYNRRVLFGDVEGYWCRLHGCWHIGHRDKHRYARLKLREDVTVVQNVGQA